MSMHLETLMSVRRIMFFCLTLIDKLPVAYLHAQYVGPGWCVVEIANIMWRRDLACANPTDRQWFQVMILERRAYGGIPLGKMGKQLSKDARSKKRRRGRQFSRKTFMSIDHRETNEKLYQIEEQMKTHEDRRFCFKLTCGYQR